ncbi:hypothetical protein GBA52_026359 [Prunus armeniaca]|nr:hypothetical protein GBA52_026359 [Prunus armeniaca]
MCICYDNGPMFDLILCEYVPKVKGLGDRLKTNLHKGVQGDNVDLMKQKKAFGTNTYPRKNTRSFWGTKEGWYDGGSIAITVLVIVIRAISDYIQSLQFQNLNEEKRNIHLEVIRGGRRVEVSIYDLVVGDVVPLNIVDQVPADGILINGHSLVIDESSMTGDHNIVSLSTCSIALFEHCLFIFCKLYFYCMFVRTPGNHF